MCDFSNAKVEQLRPLSPRHRRVRHQHDVVWFEVCQPQTYISVAKS